MSDDNGGVIIIGSHEARLKTTERDGLLGWLKDAYPHIYEALTHEDHGAGDDSSPAA